MKSTTKQENNRTLNDDDATDRDSKRSPSRIPQFVGSVVVN